MIHTYKLGKIAGPSGTFSGYVLLVFGIITAIFTFTGIVVLILGLYLAFGHYCSNIDSENRRVRKGIKLLWWTISGRWTDIDNTYKSEIRKIKGKYTVYSSANRKLELEQTDYKIYLISSDHSKSIALAKYQDKDKALTEMESINQLLKLNIHEE